MLAGASSTAAWGAGCGAGGVGVYGFRGFRVNVQINQFGRQVLDLGFHVYRGMERRLGFEV